MRMKHLEIKCPSCSEWMTLAEFDITWTAAEGLTVKDEIECPNPDCELIFRVTNGEVARGQE
jgi:hypothetical protein